MCMCVYELNLVGVHLRERNFSPAETRHMLILLHLRAKERENQRECYVLCFYSHATIRSSGCLGKLGEGNSYTMKKNVTVISTNISIINLTTFTL